jgi:hypothetical protein
MDAWFSQDSRRFFAFMDSFSRNRKKTDCLQKWKKNKTRAKKKTKGHAPSVFLISRVAIKHSGGRTTQGDVKQATVQALD